jgi:Resolvase, N terminal domain
MFHGWENFFIVGASAGATLIGLLFVAITLGTGLSTPQGLNATSAFLTPTLILFGGVLLECMAVLPPWPSAWPVGIILGLCGLTGLVLQIHVILRQRLRILGMGLDTATANGRLMLNVLGSVAQFEREVMLERQREGIAKAKGEGKYKGRAPIARAKADDIRRLAIAGATRESIAASAWRKRPQRLSCVGAGSVGGPPVRVSLRRPAPRRREGLKAAGGLPGRR